MSASKHFDKIAWAITALMLVVALLFMNGAALGIEVMSHTMGYENRLFDNTRVHTIDIVMDDWDKFIKSATSEEYSTASMVIDGEAYKNVAIRGKGNTSLSSVSSMGSSRYSFKVEFDHYDSSLTYHGLDKLSLNNLIQDSTMMKDYLTYTMMYEFGAKAPLCSFVYITVNGEDWGLYLAVEGVEDSFLERNYGADYGELYKPDSMSFGGGRGNGKNFNMDDFMSGNSSQGTSGFSGIFDFFGGSSNSGSTDTSSSATPTMPSGGSFDPSQMMPRSENGTSSGSQGRENGSTATERPITRGNKTPSKNNGGASFGGGGMGGFGMGSSDVKLQYIDDNISSYQNIWNNAKTDITSNDQTRLIDSLKKLSNKEDIESVVNIEDVIRYFVVHNYVCNGDSYTGSMIHNYYLYEENGQLSMLPWDYNLAYGTFQGGNGQSTVNTPIDSPVSGGAGTDRPMWHWILSDEKYTKLYHEYFEEFLKTVDVQAIITNAYDLIKPYVQKDPTAFYSLEQFELGVSTMLEFCRLRSQSISMQLENSETTTNMNYVDASGLTLSNMGSMGGNKGGFGGGGMPDMGGSSSRPNMSGSGNSGSGSMPNMGGFGSSSNTSRPDMSGANAWSGMGSVTKTNATTEIPSSGTFPSMGSMPGGFDMSQLPEGFDPSQMMPGGFDVSQIPEGFDPSQMMPGDFDMSQIPEGIFPGQSQGGSNAPETGSSSSSNRPSRDNMQMPSGSFGNGMGTSAGNNSNITWLAFSVLILAAGLIIAKLYRR